MVYLFFILAVFIIQTTVLRSFSFRPDFFLILFMLFALRKKRNTVVLLGFLMGLFLDVFSGYSLFYTLAYTATAALISFFPYALFRDNDSAIFFGVIAATFIFQVCMTIIVSVLMHKTVLLPWWYYLFIVFANAISVSILYKAQQWLLNTND